MSSFSVRDGGDAEPKRTKITKVRGFITREGIKYVVPVEVDTTTSGTIIKLRHNDIVKSGDLVTFEWEEDGRGARMEQMSR